jgi:hypothetical protein
VVLDHDLRYSIEASTRRVARSEDLELTSFAVDLGYNWKPGVLRACLIDDRGE